MTKPYKENEWNNWTDISKNIPFKSTNKNYGDGEEKLASEYNIKPLGQNCTYDLEMPFNEQWEIKKLDQNNSFRIGVDVMSSYTEVIINVIIIFKKIVKIQEQFIENNINLKDYTTDINLLIVNLTKHEVSSSNLQKINNIIEFIKNIIKPDDKQIVLYSPLNGKKSKYSLQKAFSLLSIDINDKKEIKNIIGNYDKILLLNTIYNEIQFFKDFSFCEILNNIVRTVFTNKKLVIVDEINGYKPITNLTKLICNRITSGRPRCQYL